MLHLYLFTDGSVNTQLKIGYGAYLLTPDINEPIDLLKDSVKAKRFESTSSTKLELQTLLWALDEVIAFTAGRDFTLTIYTDSQNIIGLPARRARLEQNDYISSKGKPLNNSELYKVFYRVTSELKYELVKVSGHKSTHQKTDIDKFFTLVDRASRKALRRGASD